MKSLKVGMIFGLSSITVMNAVTQNDQPAKRMTLSYIETMVTPPPDTLRVDTFY